MLVLPKSKWIFFSLNRTANTYFTRKLLNKPLWLSGRSLKQMLTIHTIHPYATKQRSKYARSVVKGPCHFMPCRYQRPERKLALQRFLHTPLSKKRNNFSERLLYSWLSKNLFCGPNFGNSFTCVLEVFRKRARGRGGGGDLLHMNINLDSNNIIITGHKIVASFFLRHFLLSVSILGAICMHTLIFSSWGEWAAEYFELGVYPRVTNTYMYICQRYPVYTHVRGFLATKAITTGVLICQDKGVGSRMPIISLIDCHKLILITPAVLILSACLHLCYLI